MTMRTIFLRTLAAVLFAAPVRADNAIDVTEKVAAAVKGGALSIEASNLNFGDPTPKVAKKLKVEYSIGETTATKVVVENDTLEIKPPPGKRLIVLKAVYGPMNDPVAPFADVTRELAKAVKNGRTLSIGANDTALRRPVPPGPGKKLVAEYTVGGTAHTVTVKFGETLTLPAAADGAGELVIVKATYGVF